MPLVERGKVVHRSKRILTTCLGMSTSLRMVMGPFLSGHSMSICGCERMALHDRCALTDLGEIVAEIGLLLDQSDQTVLDLQENRGTWLDLLGEGAVSGDGELLAAALNQPVSTTATLWDIRSGWVGIQVDMVDGEDVVFRVGAVLCVCF